MISWANAHHFGHLPSMMIATSMWCSWNYDVTLTYAYLSTVLEFCQWAILPHLLALPWHYQTTHLGIDSRGIKWLLDLRLWFRFTLTMYDQFLSIFCVGHCHSFVLWLTLYRNIYIFVCQTFSDPKYPQKP